MLTSQEMASGSIDGRLAHPGIEVFSENRERQKIRTRLKLNNTTYCLEFGEDKSMVSENLLNSYQYYSIFETEDLFGLEIRLATQNFVPETRKILFTNIEDREELVSILNDLPVKRNSMTYTNDLSHSYQTQEFLTMKASEKRSKGNNVISASTAVKYFENAGGTVPKHMKPNSTCSFSEFHTLCNKMMAFPTSSILQKTFERFATHFQDNDIERLMTVANLTDFLRTHQEEEEDNLSNETVLQLLQKHRDKVK